MSYAFTRESVFTVRVWFLVLVSIIWSILFCNEVVANHNAQIEQPLQAAIGETHSVSNKDKKTKYRIGVSYINSYPMFSSANRKDKGLGWAILENFAESQNIQFEYAPMPISRLQPSMDSGAVDFIFPDNPHWGSYRSNRLPNIFSGPVLSAISATFVRTENQNITFEELSKVAIPFGYSANTWTLPIQTYNIKSVPVRDLGTALHSITQGSVEAADVEYNIGKYIIAQNPNLTGLSIAPNLPNTSVDYHLSSIKHITLLEDLTVFIKQEKVFIEQLRREYGIKYHHEVYTNTP